MVRYEDECCGCATENYPCMGSACRNRHVPHYYCDSCGYEGDSDEIHVVDDEQLCEDCLKAKFPTIAEVGE